MDDLVYSLVSGVFVISTGKATLIHAGLQSTVLRLWEALEQEPMLAATSEDQRQEARKAVERAIFSEVHTLGSWNARIIILTPYLQIYMAALYPNIEADVSRDLVLQQHIGRLSEVVSPNHRDLKIPRRYQYECPWPAAQVRTCEAFS